MPLDVSKMSAKLRELPANFVKICNPDPKKAGKSLMVLNALGMLFAAASDTYAVVSDKDTSPKEKKFLIPAGIATGAAKIGIYYLMTDKIIKGLKESAEKTIKNMSSTDFKINAKKFAISTYEKAQKGLFGTKIFKKSDKYITSMRNTLFENGNIAGEITQKAKELYKDKTIAAGGVLGAFIGAVIGCSIITPIIRDVSAYFVQKKMLKDNVDSKAALQINPLKIGEGLYNNDFMTIKRQPCSLNNYMALTRNNMKI